MLTDFSQKVCMLRIHICIALIKYICMSLRKHICYVPARILALAAADLNTHHIPLTLKIFGSFERFVHGEY